MRVRETERGREERDSARVCVSKREREREDKDPMCVCVCVFVTKREMIQGGSMCVRVCV